MRRMPYLVALLILLGSSAPALASQDLVPDVPTKLGGVTRPTWTVTREDTGIYTPLFSLPAGVVIDGLQRMPSGNWLLSLEAPAELGGTLYDPRDVIQFDGIAGFSLYFDGEAMGVGAEANVDAILQDTAGNLVLSFDIPITLRGVDYEPADLVRYDGANFSLYFDASATTPPIPASTNVTSADRYGSLTILAFDVPTTLGATTYSPGQLVAWNGVSFTLFPQFVVLPIGSQVAALAESSPSPPPSFGGSPSSAGGRKQQSVP